MKVTNVRRYDYIKAPKDLRLGDTIIEGNHITGKYKERVLTTHRAVDAVKLRIKKQEQPR
jgi:hypothetical protein